MKTEIYKEGFVDALIDFSKRHNSLVPIQIIDKLSKEYKIKNEN